MKRKLAYVGFAFLGGLFIASWDWGKYNLQFIILGLLITLILFLLLKDYRIYVAVVAVSFFAGISYLSLFTHFKYEKIIAYDGDNIKLSGVVTDYSYVGSDRGRLTVKGIIND